MSTKIYLHSNLPKSHKSIDTQQQDMIYNILEARIERKNNQMQRVTVLVEISKNDVRAIFATNKFRSGYMMLQPDAKISEELLQEVAATGLETVDRDEIFPNWKKFYFPSTIVSQND